jgi:hypothetical protein
MVTLVPGEPEVGENPVITGAAPADPAPRRQMMVKIMAQLKDSPRGARLPGTYRENISRIPSPVTADAQSVATNNLSEVRASQLFS